MTLGPGKYDAMANNVRLITGAAAVVVVVFEWNGKVEFCGQLPAGDAAVQRACVNALRNMIEQMERDIG